MRVGILKPDHLGDLILSAPAIAALCERFDDVVLLCHPQTIPLAQHLFPELDLWPILFPHLDRTRSLDFSTEPLADLRGTIDLLICLRWECIIGPQVQRAQIPFHASYRDDLSWHIVADDYDVVVPLAGPYDPLTSYAYPFGQRPDSRPSGLEAVGLCISVGCELNAWPLNHWLNLAERISRRGIEIVWVGGPRETARLRVLAEASAECIGYMPRVLTGGTDYARFLSQLADSVDLVIATDSGTAHLASLVRPILSLFGGSPWRRYAPFGRFNAVLTREMPCSPCRQFDGQSINLCHSRECLTNLLPGQVEQGLDAYLAGDDFREPHEIANVWIAQAPWERHLPASSNPAERSLERVAGAHVRVHTSALSCR